MPDVAKNSSLKFHKYFYWLKKRLTLWVTYWYICCGSIFTFGAKYFEPVQNILNQFKFFEPVQIFQPNSIWFFILFLHQNKKIFLAPLIFSSSSLFSSSPLYLPHLLFPPCSPNIPAHILFTSMRTVWALNNRSVVYLCIHVLMPYQWATETWMQVPLFF